MFASNASYEATLTDPGIRKCTAGKGNLSAVNDKSKCAINHYYYYYYYRHSDGHTFDYLNNSLEM